MANRPPRTPRARRERPQPPAIEARGERELTLEGVAYRLRPSRQAVSKIESETGFALLELVRMGNAGGLSIDTLGIVAAELIRAGAEPADTATQHVGHKQIGDLIYDQGVMAAQAVITLTLLNAATGGRTVLGEPKAATA